MQAEFSTFFKNKIKTENQSFETPKIRFSVLINTYIQLMNFYIIVQLRFKDEIEVKWKRPQAEK